MSSHNTKRLIIWAVLPALVAALLSVAQASTSKDAQAQLNKLLLGKDVKALVDLPASKDGLDVYFIPSSNKHVDSRGVDMEEMTKWLKAKRAGVERDEWATITNVKIDSDKIEIHLEGGEGRRGSKHARGSRLNLKFQKDLKDSDIAPQNILRFMSRLLDVSRIELMLEEKGMPAELRKAIESHTVVENMTYQMVLIAFGDPDEKKVDDVDANNLKETWFYLKSGHRWVIHFENGKVAKTQVF